MVMERRRRRIRPLWSVLMAGWHRIFFQVVMSGMSEKLMVWLVVGAAFWWVGLRVCWRRRGRGGSGGVGRGGGWLVWVWVGGFSCARKWSRVVWWLVGGVGGSFVLVVRLGWVGGSGW